MSGYACSANPTYPVPLTLPSPARGEGSGRLCSYQARSGVRFEFDDAFSDG